MTIPIFHFRQVSTGNNQIEKMIKVRQQQEQQEQQSHPLKERFRNTCSRSKRLSMAETTARQLAV